MQTKMAELQLWFRHFRRDVARYVSILLIWETLHVTSLQG